MKLIILIFLPAFCSAQFSIFNDTIWTYSGGKYVAEILRYEGKMMYYHTDSTYGKANKISMDSVETFHDEDLVFYDINKDENGFIYFQDVVICPQKTKEHIRSKVKQWLAENINDSKKSLELDSEEVLIFNTNFVMETLYDGTNVRISFTVKIEIKDGRYRYTFFDFIESSGVSQKKRVEDTLSYIIKENGKVRERMAPYKRKLISTCFEMQKSISLFVNNAGLEEW